MKKRRSILMILCLCLTVSLFGCRAKVKETESETQTETITETEPLTEKKTEKETEPETKKTTVSANKAGETDKKTVKPNTVKPNSTANRTPNRTPGTNNNTAAYPTQQCPYCYQQISTAPNGDGTTVYSVHVAQEKNWADTYGYGNTPPQTEAPQPSTNAPSGGSEDAAQCPYCYQWFSVSDGTYAAHIAAEAPQPSTNAPVQQPPENFNPGGTTEYLQCPKCGNVYPAGPAYDTHLCQ